jgi:hypothetical protein
MRKIGHAVLSLEHRKVHVRIKEKILEHRKGKEVDFFP